MTVSLEPSITIVIPTLNEEMHLIQCLQSLLDDPYPRDKLKIVIVDGGSTDRTRELALGLSRQCSPSKPAVHLVENPKRLQAAAFNMVMMSDDSPLLMRCDAHAVYPPNFITNALAALRQHDTPLVVYGDAPQARSCFQKAVAFAQNTKVGVGNSQYRLGNWSGWVDHGKHGLFRTDVVKKLGGYDESFSHNEDSELSYRFIKAGYKIWLDKRLTVGYYPRDKMMSLARQYWNYGKGRRKTIRKHKMTIKPRQALPVVLVVMSPILLLLGMFVNSIFLIPLGVYLLLLSIVAASAALVQKTPCLVLSFVAFIIMHFAWGLGYCGKTND